MSQHEILASNLFGALIARFDRFDKVKLAQQMVAALELTIDESAAEKAAEALGRQLTPDEKLRIEVLELIAADHEYFAITHPPDDVAAPKSDR